jgi:cyclopropane-fatty-acyl-phospholipid synthase
MKGQPVLDVLQSGIDLVELGLIPDGITRTAIRRLCAKRAQLAKSEEAELETTKFLEALRQQPVALFPEKANEQHYELPAEFFELVLGPHRKYSCCYFVTTTASLAQAEQEALLRTCEHAELHDGQTILELGCGWGSLSLWMAERYPNSQIVAISNSRPQRCYIEEQARQRSLTNLRVITSDINDFQPYESFDRVVSVEMFEHIRNYELMLQRIGTWLNPHGKVLIHHFCHRAVAYPFDVEGSANWMGRYFFTGGLMPAADLLSRFSQDLHVTKQWHWNGSHYQRTADAWLALMDERRRPVMEILKRTYGRDANRWFYRWRMFFLAVSELFGYGQGEEWFVTHALLEPSLVSRKPSGPLHAVQDV